MENRNCSIILLDNPKQRGRATYKKKNNKYNITETKSIVEKYIKQGSYSLEQDILKYKN